MEMLTIISVRSGIGYVRRQMCQTLIVQQCTPIDFTSGLVANMNFYDYSGNQEKDEI
jgi:hypothetical protein